MTAETGAPQTEIDASGLPIDPAARSAELDRLIAVGEGEMRQGIEAWQRDDQKRADHKVLLEERDRMKDGGPDGMGFYATATLDDVRGIQPSVEGAIAEFEAEMKRDIRGYNARESADARAIYLGLLEVRAAINRRLS